MDIKRAGKTYIVLILIYFCPFTCMFGLEFVNKCPLTESDWNIASSEWKCPVSTKYHCLQIENYSLVEICLPPKSGQMKGKALD